MVRDSARGKPGRAGHRAKVPLPAGAPGDEGRDQPFAQQGRQRPQTVALETLGGKGRRQGVNRQKRAPRRERRGARPRTARGVRRRGWSRSRRRPRASGSPPLTEVIHAASGSLELRRVAEDQSSVRAVGAGRHGPPDLR